MFVLMQLFKIVPLSSLGVGPEVSNNMSKSPESHVRSVCVCMCVCVSMDAAAAVS